MTVECCMNSNFDAYLIFIVPCTKLSAVSLASLHIHPISTIVIKHTIPKNDLIMEVDAC